MPNPTSDGAGSQPGQGTAACGEPRPGMTLWFTGLSGSGKSTLAKAVEAECAKRLRRVEVLDGDDIRRILSGDLGFTQAHRNTNVRRIGHLARLLSRNGVIAIVAAISPYRSVRDEVRSQHETPFVEVHVDCPVSELMRRDTKGLYARAMRGEIGNLTGISDPYEPPPTPELHMRTDQEGPVESCARIMRWLDQRRLV